MSDKDKVYIVCSETTRHTLRTGSTFICSDIHEVAKRLQEKQKECYGRNGRYRYRDEEANHLDKFITQVTYRSPSVWVSQVDAPVPFKRLKDHKLIEELREAGYC